MATQYRVASENPDPLDVSRAELWSEDRWQEPIARLRAESPIHYCEDSKFGPYWSVTPYKPTQTLAAMPKPVSSCWEYGGNTVLGRGGATREGGATPEPRSNAV